jgi:hypothetical protein
LVSLLSLSSPRHPEAHTPRAPKPFAVKLGGLYAGKGAEENTFTRQSNSNTQTYFGVSYERYSKSRTLPIAYGVYFDDIAENRKKADGIYDTTASGAGFGVSGRYLFKRSVAH